MPAIKPPIIGMIPAIKSAMDRTISMMTGAAACMPFKIPGITFVIITDSISSAIGTICSVINPTSVDRVLLTEFMILIKLSNTAVPFAPKISSILSLAAPRFPSENTPLIVSPTVVTTATILSNTARPPSPNIRPIAARTSSKWFRNSWTAVITPVTMPTTGKSFPAIPPRGPSRELPIFPIGPRTFLNMFPMGAITPPSLPNPAVINFPMLPSGLLAITDPRPDNMPPSLPPNRENGFNTSPATFPRPEPMPPKIDMIPLPAALSLDTSPALATCASAALLLNVSRTIFAVVKPLLMCRKPSFAPSPAILKAARPAATLRTV